MKLPRPPGALDLDRSTDLHELRDPLFRIFRAGGHHPSAWDELRRVGPIPGMRFDPYTGPLRVQPRGVMYVSTSLLTAFAEVYQQSRVISAEGEATIAAWVPTRPLVLLDLSSLFLVRNGAAAAVMMGTKRYTQEWAAAIDGQLGDELDGLLHLSSMTSRFAVTLFERASDSFPDRPSFHRGVGDPLVRGLVAGAAKELGYGIR